MRRITLVTLLVVVLIAGVIYLPGFAKYLKLKRKEADLDQEIKRLQSEIAQLQEEEHLLKTDLSRLEQVVREELGLVKPGEVVLKVVEEEIPEVEKTAAPKNPNH